MNQTVQAATIWLLAVLVATVIATVAVLLLSRSRKSPPASGQTLTEGAVEDVNHFFNEEFREELRNRGRMHFEQAITENAMFLKQDLDMTISQVNDYLKKEIGGKLDEEFANYARAMQDAQQLALDSLQKSATEVETTRQELDTALKTYVSEREAALLKVYEENMARIVEHYLLAALGDKLDMKTQLPFILAELEAHKQQIMDDIKL